MLSFKRCVISNIVEKQYSLHTHTHTHTGENKKTNSLIGDITASEKIKKKNWRLLVLLTQYEMEKDLNSPCLLFESSMWEYLTDRRMQITNSSTVVLKDGFGNIDDQ